MVTFTLWVENFVIISHLEKLHLLLMKNETYNHIKKEILTTKIELTHVILKNRTMKIVAITTLLMKV
jgi:hypothetical protein